MIDLIAAARAQLESGSVGMTLEQREVRALVALGNVLEAAKAEVARLREALRSIADNSCCGACREAALVARAALQEKPHE